MAANKSSCTDGKEKKIVPTAKKNKDSGPDQEEYTMVARIVGKTQHVFNCACRNRDFGYGIVGKKNWKQPRRGDEIRLKVGNEEWENQGAGMNSGSRLKW